jgi:hypothetical protein
MQTAFSVKNIFEYVYILKSSKTPLENLYEQIDMQTARSHACRIACKLLLNKQLIGKAQRHIWEFNPVCDKYLIPCVL